MKNNDKALLWTCNDCSEEPVLEKLAVRLQTVDNTTKFKEAFEAAKKFNQLVREEKTEELVYAPAIEDHEEVADPADDPDKNKTADEEGKDDGEHE